MFTMNWKMRSALVVEQGQFEDRKTRWETAQSAMEAATKTQAELKVDQMASNKAAAKKKMI